MLRRACPATTPANEPMVVTVPGVALSKRTSASPGDVLWLLTVVMPKMVSACAGNAENDSAAAAAAVAAAAAQWVEVKRFFIGGSGVLSDHAGTDHNPANMALVLPQISTARRGPSRCERHPHPLKTGVGPPVCERRERRERRRHRTPSTKTRMTLLRIRTRVVAGGARLAMPR